MKIRATKPQIVLLISAALSAALPATVSAETFSWAGTTDPQTLDPHAVNTAPVLGFLNNVYEGLVRRDKQMQVEAALATSWEQLPEGGWRFNLREGVTFHDGSTFDSDDVLFSYERASSEAADTSSWFAPVSEVRVVDDLTIDFLTSAPNPLFPSSIANFMIMDRDWTVDNDAELPSKEAENHATRNANGTGAYKVTARDPGVRTELEPFGQWWDTNESNITRAVFTPIGQSATGMAALLSGEIDFISPIPLQDVPRMKQRDGFTVHEGIEARVIMFGFKHDAEELMFSDDVSGKNPFQDVRVRTAAYQSFDVDTLIDKIMRGNAQPAAQLVSDTMNGYSEGLSERLEYDPDNAKALLLGSWNFGAYSNERVDELLPMIQTELDEQKRQAMVDEAHAVLQDERAYIPLYVQPLIWASKDNIELTQRSDNFFILRWVSVN